MKTCKGCNEPKALEEFPKQGRYRRARCAPCHRIWRKDYFLRHRFGIDLEEYDAMFKRQEGRCAICRREVDHTLHVDHCHETGRVRGLLCIPCNLWLGYMEDDLQRVKDVVHYLGTALLAQ